VMQNNFPTKSSEEYIVLDPAVENTLYDKATLMHNNSKFWDI
jgi:hypothetical protein